MKCMQWSVRKGVYARECTQGSARNGMCTMKCAQWSVHNEVHAMECTQCSVRKSVYALWLMHEVPYAVPCHFILFTSLDGTLHQRCSTAPLSYHHLPSPPYCKGGSPSLLRPRSPPPSPRTARGCIPLQLRPHSFTDGNAAGRHRCQASLYMCRDWMQRNRRVTLRPR